MPNHFWFFPCGEKGQKIIFEFPLRTSYTKIVIYESKDTQNFKHFLGSVVHTAAGSNSKNVKYSDVKNKRIMKRVFSLE